MAPWQVVDFLQSRRGALPVSRAAVGRASSARVSRDLGFTLIEVMLALAIMAFMVGTLWSTFSQTSRVKKQVEASQDRIHTARVALMRMSREIEMAYLSEAEPITVTEKRTRFVGSQSSSVDMLQFSYFGHQSLRANAAEADSSMIVYYGESDPNDRSLTNLMRRETRRIEALDPMKAPGEAYILCPGVTRVRFSYYDHQKKDWKDEWDSMGADGQQYLPTHVRIWLSFIDERGQEVTYTTSARVMITEKVGYRPARS